MIEAGRAIGTGPSVSLGGVLQARIGPLLGSMSVMGPWTTSTHNPPLRLTERRRGTHWRVGGADRQGPPTLLHVWGKTETLMGVGGLEWIGGSATKPF